MKQWDVIVIGVGAVGSAALRAAAGSGAQVLGIERHVPANRHGSSHGHSRIFRHAYFEHPDYVPLLRHATARFESLERQSRVSLLNRCGMLLMGGPDSAIVRGAMESALNWGLQVDALDATALRGRFPWFAVADDDSGVSVQTDAGNERAAAAIIAAGPWAAMLLPELRPLLEVTRQVQAWLAPALGDALADLALRGHTDLPIDFLSPRRFAG